MKVTIHIQASFSLNSTVLHNFFAFFSAKEHEKCCLHPKKTGAEVMLALETSEFEINEGKKLFSTLMELLSYEKIIFNGMFHYFLTIMETKAKASWPSTITLLEKSCFIKS